MKTRHILYCMLTIALTNRAVAQDAHFSQYAETPSSINPALAGVTYNTRAQVNFKDQWGTVGQPYRTIGFSFEQTIKHKKLKGSYFAVAGNIFREESGDAHYKALNPNVGVSYLQKINKKLKFSGGLQSGIYYRTIDISGLKWGEQYDGYNWNSELPTGEPTTPRSSIISYDMGGGVNLNFVQSDKFLSAKNAAKFDVGMSAYHYSMGRSSFITASEKLTTRFCTYFNADFNIPNSKNAIMPSFLYMRQGSSSEFITGALLKFIIGDQSTYTALRKPRALSIGGYYRFKDAIIPTMLFQYNKYAFGLSYDINISALTPASNRRGGLELMMRYNVFPGYGVNLGRSDTKPSY